MVPASSTTLPVAQIASLHAIPMVRIILTIVSICMGVRTGLTRVHPSGVLISIQGRTIQNTTSRTNAKIRRTTRKRLTVMMTLITWRPILLRRRDSASKITLNLTKMKSRETVKTAKTISLKTVPQMTSQEMGQTAFITLLYDITGETWTDLLPKGGQTRAIVTRIRRTYGVRMGQAIATPSLVVEARRAVIASPMMRPAFRMVTVIRMMTMTCQPIAVYKGTVPSWIRV